MQVYDFPDYQIIQINTDCLSHFSYVIISQNEAIVLDPRRDPEPYLKLLSENKTVLKYVFLTHIHADYVGGHIELQKKTGSKIVMGHGAQVKFPFLIAEDGNEFKLGAISLRAIHTPGHTMESTCFVLNVKDQPKAVFTGDTLFLGDVGRPDLGFLDSISPEILAEKLFDSLMRLKNLPDDVDIFSSHGAGSSCGKGIQSGSTCKIGKQKVTNKPFSMSNKEEFINYVTSDLASPPRYFTGVVLMNKMENVRSGEELLKMSKKPLTENDIKSIQKDTAFLIIDTRPHSEFMKHHIEGSVSIPLGTKYAIFASFIFNGEKIVLISNMDQLDESILRLGRVGIESVVGFLDGGIDAWHGPVLESRFLIPSELEEKLNHGEVALLDVRFQNEYDKGHLEGAQFLTLAEIAHKFETLDKNKLYHVYCGTGIRSLIAKGYLKRHGFQLITIEEGWMGISKTGMKIKTL